MDDPSVLYVTPLYTEASEGRLARFHDLVGEIDRRGEIDFRVLNLTTRGGHEQEDAIRPARSRRSFLRALYQDSPNYDLVHVVSTGSVVAAWLATGVIRNPNVVVGPTILGYEPSRPGPRYDLRSAPAGRAAKFTVDRLARRVLLSERSPVSKRFDAVFALGRYHRELLREMGVPDSKIVVLPPGVDDRVFAPEGERYCGDRDLTLLYVGPNSRHKGYDVFLEALRRLGGRLDVEAIMVGGDPPDIDLPDSVTVLGYRPRGELAALYRGADLYVQPSHDEVVPTTMVEALACGTPVVATDRLGFSECKRGENCLLFPRADAGALAERIKAYAANRAVHDEAAMANHGEYAIARTYETLVEAYERMLV